MYRLAATARKQNRQNFRARNFHGQCGHVIMAIPEAKFSAVRFCSNIVRSTIGLLSDRYASCYVLLGAETSQY